MRKCGVIMCQFHSNVTKYPRYKCYEWFISHHHLIPLSFSLIKFVKCFIKNHHRRRFHLRILFIYFSTITSFQSWFSMVSVEYHIFSHPSGQYFIYLSFHPILIRGTSRWGSQNWNNKITQYIYFGLSGHHQELRETDVLSDIEWFYCFNFVMLT